MTENREEECRAEILILFSKWLEDNHPGVKKLNPSEALMFMTFLHDNRRDLLASPMQGDKRTRVMGWIKQAGFII